LFVAFSFFVWGFLVLWGFLSDGFRARGVDTAGRPQLSSLGNPAHHLHLCHNFPPSYIILWPPHRNPGALPSLRILSLFIFPPQKKFTSRPPPWLPPCPLSGCAPSTLLSRLGCGFCWVPQRGRPLPNITHLQRGGRFLGVGSPCRGAFVPFTLFFCLSFGIGVVGD